MSETDLQELQETLAKLVAELSEVKRQLAETNQRLDSLGAPSKPSSTPLTKIDTIPAHKDGVGFVAIAPDGQCLTSAGKDGTVKVWNLNTGQLERTLEKPYIAGGKIRNFAASADNRIFANCHGRTVLIWGHPRIGEQANVFTSEQGAVSCVNLSWDGQLLAYGIGKQVKVCDVVSGQSLCSLEQKHAVQGVAISADKQIVATSGWFKNVELSNIIAEEPLNTLPDSKVIKGTNCVLAFSPVKESAILATANHNNSIKLWDSKTGDLIRTLHGHSNAINSLAISANGKLIASGGYDSTVRVWDLSTGALIGAFSGHLKTVNYVSLSPDGQLVASGSDDGTVKIWRLGAT